MKSFSVELVWAKVQMAAAAVGAWLGYFLGGMDGLMIRVSAFSHLARSVGTL